MIKKDLFDTNASLYVLSCLMHKPLLLQDEQYVFTKTDFYKPLQQMVFGAIYNMAQNGVEHITTQDIDLYLKQFDSQYEYYTKNKGYEFVLQCFQTAEGSDEKQFDYYYTRLKKFSMLRDFEAIGIDTTEFYDTSNTLDRDAEDRKLNSISLNAIGDRIRDQLAGIENKHIGKDEGTSQNAAQGMRALVASLNENPEVGLPLDGSYINSATRGARLGKLYTYSAPSGSGKTRYMVGNACAISMPYIDKNGKVVMRGEGKGDYQRILYIATEQQADEIQTMILAYVSGVNEKKILLSNRTEEEERRIQQGLDIVDAYGPNFIIECIPDPSIALVKARLRKYIIQDGIDYIFYDYIFSSPGLLSEFKDIAVREDVALMMLSNSIKEIAMEHNVFIQSATQLNDAWSKREIGPRDQNCIRGSKAIADKIDIGMIGIRITDEEKKQVDAIWGEVKRALQRKFPGETIPDPNIVVDIYKNRRGDLNAVKIFRYFDFGTCHAVDLFITDSSYKTIQDVPLLQFDQRPQDFLSLKSGGVL